MEITEPKSSQPIPEDAKKVFTGQIFDVYQWEQKMYDGTTATFERLKRLDSVIVFPIMDDGSILLTEQEQPGKEKYIGATGGRVERGEEVLEAAQRELLDETGYIADELILWDAQNSTPKIDWPVYTFVAKGLKKIQEMNPDSGEKITLKPVSFDEFIELATRKDFSDKKIQAKIFEAKLDPIKMAELKKLLSA